MFCKGIFGKWSNQLFVYLERGKGRKGKGDKILKRKFC
jgi:hypothetical protein